MKCYFNESHQWAVGVLLQAICLYLITLSYSRGRCLFHGLMWLSAYSLWLEAAICFRVKCAQQFGTGSNTIFYGFMRFVSHEDSSLSN